MQAFENKCYRMMLDTSYKAHKTIEYVSQQVNIVAGRQEPLLTTARHRKLSWFGHVCSHGTLPKTTPRGTVYGNRRRGRPPKLWRANNIEEWTDQSLSSLLRVADDGSRWAFIAAEASVEVPQRRLGVMEVSLLVI